MSDAHDYFLLNFDILISCYNFQFNFQSLQCLSWSNEHLNTFKNLFPASVFPVMKHHGNFQFVGLSVFQVFTGSLWNQFATLVVRYCLQDFPAGIW